MANSPSDNPDPRPLYILLGLAFALCAFLFWIGIVCVRLWFYKGALGPEPEKFIILGKELKDRYHKTALAEDYDQGRQRGNRQMTMFPQVPTSTASHANTGLSAAPEPRGFSTLPTINIQDVDVDNLEEFRDSKVRKHVAEEFRISRLPAFVQDDCGDGSEFPDIPIALEPIEEHHASALEVPSLSRTENYLKLGVTKVDRSSWLTVDHTYIEQHEAGKSMLDRNRYACIQVMQEGEAACEELMNEVVEFLVTTYPQHFSIRMKGRRKHVRNELTQEEYCLVRPFDRHPLEVCARLAMEDFQVLVKGEFTRQYYLQASATLFPAGWKMRSHIGKSLDMITSNRGEPMPLWEDLPAILNLPDLSRYSFTPSLLIHTSTFIQTQPDKRPQAHVLHIQHPMDFFAGQIHNLLPHNLLVRRETRTFRRLPKTGAIVISSRTSTARLKELGGQERKELLREVQKWGDDEARFKGRDLWITAVEGWCAGKPTFRDDATVFSHGS